jgi:PAS domain S-box-containing protein
MSSKSRRELSGRLASWLKSNQHHLLKAGAGPGSAADRKAALALLAAFGRRLGAPARARASRKPPRQNARRPARGIADDPARLARIAGALRDRTLARLGRSRAAGARELRRFAAGAFDSFLAESLTAAEAWPGRRSRDGGSPRPAVPLLRRAFKNSKDAIFILALDGRILDANRTAARRYGYAATRLQKMHLRELTAPPERRQLPAHLKELRKEKHRRLEATHVRRDGRPLQVELSSWLVDLGDRDGTVMISRDISARKRAEAALQKGEERFRKIFEEGPLGMATVGRDYRLLEVNPRFAKMLGYSRKELTALKFPDITHPDDIDEDVKLARRVCAGRIPHYRIEKRYLKKSGEILWVDMAASVVRDRKGRPLYGLATIEEITDRKRTEEELRKLTQSLETRVAERTAALSDSAKRHEAILHTALDGFLLIDAEGRIRQVNEAYCRMTGFSAGELTRMRIFDLDAMASKQEIIRRLRWLMEGKEETFQTRHLRKDGGTIELEVNAAYLPLDGGAVFAFVRDITARKGVEQSLRQSEEKFRTIFENAPVMIDSFDERGRCLLWNRECEKTLGWKRNEILASDDPLSLFYPDKKMRNEVLADIKRADGRFREYRVVAKDGPERIQLWANFRLPNRTLIATGLDITDRKRDERALREAHDELEARVEARTRELMETQRRLRDIMDFSSAVIYLKDTQGRFLFINKRFEALFRASAEALVGKTDHDFFPKKIADAFLENDRRVLEAGTPVEFEEIAPHPDGPHTYISMKFPLRDTSGAIYGVCGISTDITERVQSEMALKGAQARLETLLASSPAVIYSARVGGDWSATFVSDNVTAQTGYLPADFTENPRFWVQHIHPDDAPRVLRELPRLLEKGHHRHEYRFLHKDGSYRWMEDEVTLVRDEKGRPFESVGYWIDYTDRKRAEQELRETSGRLDLAVESSRLGIWEWDIVNDRLVPDGRTEALFGREPGSFQGGFEAFLALVSSEDRERVSREVGRALKERELFDTQYDVIWPDGSVHTLAARGRVRPNEKGSPEWMTGVIWDITERQQAQEALRRSEAQFTRLVESEIIGVITADIHGNIIEANDAFLKMVGYGREEFPLRWDKLTPPEWRPLDERAIEKLLKTRRVAPWEKEFFRKDGSRVPILVGVAVLDEEKRTGICPVLDLSDLKHTQVELQKSEANLSALIENTQDSICSMDRDFRLITFNPHFEDQFFLAFNRKPEVGASLDDLIPEENYSELRRRWKGRFERVLDGEKSTIETQYRMQGEERHYIVSLTPIGTKGGAGSGITFYAKDITELKSAQRRLERRLETEKLVANVSRVFLNLEPEGIGEAITASLRMIGEFERVDRSRLYLLSGDTRKLESAHEWCAEGVEPQIESWKKLPLEEFSWTVARVLDRRVTRIDRVADLPPEAAREKALFETFGVRSVVGVPFLMRGGRVGVLALQVCRSEREWTDETVRCLQVVAEAMSNALERARAQRELLELSHKNQMILETAGEGIYGLDRDGRVTFVNPAAARMIGWEAKDLLDKPMHAVLHHTRPDGSRYPREECPIHLVLHKGGTRKAEEDLFWRKDGGSFPVEYIASPLYEKGRLAGAVVTFNDITLRKRAEEVRYMAHLLGEVPEAVLVMEESGKILFWSKGAEKLCGYRPQEIIGEGLGAIFAREDPAGGAAAILSFLADPDTGDEYRGEHLIRRSDGETRLAAMHFSPSQDPSGRRAAWIGVVQEITESRRKEREMMHAQRLAELGTLAAGVAHEINNPLTVLSGNIQTLMGRSRQDGPARKRLEQMQRVCNRIGTVVNGLLQIASPTGEQWVLSDINESIEEALALLEGLELKNRIRIVRRYGADLPKLQLLKGGLPTIVLNLVKNAMDAIRKDGVITVTTAKLPCAAPGDDSAEDPACAFPEGEPSHPRVCLCIRDTGSGIAPHDLTRVFDPFFSTKEPGKGKGLGLTLARSIVSLHQGTIDVHSDAGRGTTFRVTLPLS